MKQIKLDLDGLQIESFETTPVIGRRGTVFGRDSGTAYTDCWGANCHVHPDTPHCPFVTDTCSQGLSPDNTRCDISCEVACPTPTCG